MLFEIVSRANRDKKTKYRSKAILKEVIIILTLNRNLLRDLRHLRGQFIATAPIVACGGGALFISMRSTYDSLFVTQENCYSAYRFANVFAHFKRAPESLKPALHKNSRLIA